MIILLVIAVCLLSPKSVLSTPPTNTSSSCPMDLNYVQTIPWEISTCQNHHKSADSTTCCQTLLSLYGISLAQHLKQTSLFRLPDLQTSISCLSHFQTHLNSLSLPSYLTSTCFDPHQFVNTTNTCANIQTRQDWVDALGSTTSLDSACRPDLSDLTSCDSCVLAGFRVHSELVSMDKNSSHSRGCFYYTVLYAAGIVNKLGPESNGAIECIFGLTLSTKNGSPSTRELLVGFGSAGAGLAILFMFFVLVLYLWWKNWTTRSRISSFNFSGSRINPEKRGSRSYLRLRPKPGSIWFKFGELEKATDNFSPKNFIGRGQFGIVYRGYLPDKTVVAIKKIIESDVQGDAEFCNEVEIISNLKHRNLVPLRGCCVRHNELYEDGESQKYLVYEYMPNGNLRDHLFLLPENRSAGNWRKPLTWPRGRT